MHVDFIMDNVVVEIKDSDICYKCGRKDEAAVFSWEEPYFLGFGRKTNSIIICERCIAKIFKMFDPSK